MQGVIDVYSHLHIHIVIVPVVAKEAHCMRVFGTRLRIHKVVCEGGNCVSSVQDVRWRDETVPFVPTGCVDEL